MEEHNSFADEFPNLVEQWDKENSLQPDEVRPYSDKVVWWRCMHGHRWQAPVKARSVGKGCPYCSGRYATEERNLGVCFPLVALEWDSSKNHPVTPRDVPPGSKQKYWWICEQGHSWQAQVVNRTTGGTQCPVCQNRTVTPDNSLAATRPEIAAEWHPAKNAPLGAHDVVAGSAKRVWWQCRYGHEWAAAISNRTKKMPTGARVVGSTRRNSKFASTPNSFPFTPTPNGAPVSRGSNATSSSHPSSSPLRSTGRTGIAARRISIDAKASCWATVACICCASAKSRSAGSANRM